MELPREERLEVLVDESPLFVGSFLLAIMEPVDEIVVVVFFALVTAVVSGQLVVTWYEKSKRDAHVVKRRLRLERIHGH